MRLVPYTLGVWGLRGTFFCIAFFLSGAAFSAPASDAPAAKPAASKAAKDAKALQDDEPRSSKELAVLYQNLSEQAEKATACIFDPKCLSSDRKVLQLMVQRREILDRLAARAEKGDLEAGYWRGSIAMELARRQVNRGELFSDDLGSRKEAMLITALGAEEFRAAVRFLQAPADKGMPDACNRIAEILANGYGMHADTKRAAEYYRCAGLGFYKEGRKDEAAQVIGKMRGFLPSNHMYVVELYSKLITREPKYPWRIPSETAALMEKSHGWGKLPGLDESGSKVQGGKIQ